MAYDPFDGYASAVDNGPTPWVRDRDQDYRLPEDRWGGNGGFQTGELDTVGPGGGLGGPQTGPGYLSGVASSPQVGTGGGYGSLDRDFQLSDFQTDPGYQWRMDQGIQGIERSAAARGGLFSGGTLKALDRYNQGFASNEYQNAFNRFEGNRANRFNRFAALSGIGQTAQGQLTGYANSLGQQLGNNINNAGDAQAWNYLAQGNQNANTANAIGNGLSSAWGYYMANK